MEWKFVHVPSKKSSAGCGVISIRSSARFGNLNHAAEFSVQGAAQTQEKKTCFNKFQRIKQDMADGYKEAKKEH